MQQKKEKVIDYLESYLYQFLPEEDVKWELIKESTLEECGFDSLDRVTFIEQLEQEFEIEFTQEEADTFETLKLDGILSIVLNHLTNK